MDEEEHAEETEEIEAIEVAEEEAADKVKPEYDGGFRKPRLVSVLDTLGFDPDFFDPRTKYTIEDLTGKCVMVEALNATNSNTNFLLNMLTDAMLRTQADFVENERRVGIRAGRLPGILLESHIRDRWRREVQTNTGCPDPAYTRDPRFPNQIPLYNRVSEHGRKVSTPSQRRDSGSSFFL